MNPTPRAAIALLAVAAQKSKSGIPTLAPSGKAPRPASPRILP